MRRLIVLPLLLFVVACAQDRPADGDSASDESPPADVTAVPDTTIPQAPAITADPSREPTTRDMRATPPAPAPGDTTVRGVVRAVGAGPGPQQLVVRSGTGNAATVVGLTGSLRGELGQLVGLEVEVRGRAVDNQPPSPPRAVDVARYEIISVGGEKPYVGVLELREGAVWLAGPRAMRLAEVPEPLVTRTGAKVWIVGSVDGDRLQVQAYGVIKEP